MTTLTPNDLVALELGRSKIEAILLKAQINEMQRIMNAAANAGDEKARGDRPTPGKAWVHAEANDAV